MFVQNTTLTTIRLSQNRLGVTQPQSLAYCKNLEVLVLSKTELEGRFPFWLEALPNLQIFDLSNNNFSGPLSIKYTVNLIAMRNEERTQISCLQYMGGQNQYYQDSIVVVMKGLETELVKILMVFTAIDFSSKSFEGEIPEATGQLQALKGLNFSHKNLTAIIPYSIENSANVEWLDLSSNRLIGNIPITLAHLSFLSYLNLSMNKLIGPIPRSTQIYAFKSDSFDGNLGLCGHPLPKAFGTDSQQSPPLTSPEDEEAETVHWIE
ncbi:receptor like protein 22-like [Punica granatum]|uniref:Receptor like protein 22-like n=1 Tax=Punica granatum TaxID=22663 RepID=A0A6P8DZA1_PUNGR|nr:receptor like protein 22-like [Punica granatum]